MSKPRLRWLLIASLTGLAASCAGEVEAFAPGAGVEDSSDDEWSALGAHTARVTTARTWDGRLEGPVTFWHESGGKMGEGAYLDESKHGPWTFWHANGSLRWQGTFERGTPTGAQQAWYANGQAHYEGTWVDGLREGAFMAWHENGRLAWQGSFRGGREDGQVQRWNEDGELDRAISGVYVAGRKIGELAPAGSMQASAK